MTDASTLHPLRQRMIDDMTLRGFGVTTQRGYIAAVRRCTTHMHKPPGALLAEDARAFLLHLQANGATLHDADAFRAFLKPLRRIKWVVYAKRPFAGPDQVLSYLARYTHRVAIANSRLAAFDGERVSFKWKDYRLNGAARQKLMTLDAHEFIRRFLLHVLPDGFHHIRHYGVFANGGRSDNVAKARALLASAAHPTLTQDQVPAEPPAPATCPCCGGRMILVEVFERGAGPRALPCALAPQWCDTS